MANCKIRKFPKSRIATIDVRDIGKRKYHVSGLIELDVTESRIKIRQYNKKNSDKISFMTWFISVVSSTIKKYKASASYLKGKRKLIIFDDINVSIIIEKILDG